MPSHPGEFEPHTGDGRRFHVRMLNGEFQVFGKCLAHIAMCTSLPKANMVAEALEQAAEAAKESD